MLLFFLRSIQELFTHMWNVTIISELLQWIGTFNIIVSFFSTNRIVSIKPLKIFLPVCPHGIGYEIHLHCTTVLY